MSVLGIVVLVIVVLAILFALFVFLPRMREKGRIKRRELELRQRRKQVISEEREAADARTRQAEIAERRARIAEQEAHRERAEAELRQQRAALHEEGMADHELVQDHERERFAGTSAVPSEEAALGDGNGAREPTSAYQEGQRAAHDPGRVEDFQEGQEEQGNNGGLLGRFRRRREGEPAGRQ